MSGRRPPSAPPISEETLVFAVSGQMPTAGPVTGEVRQWDTGCLLTLIIAWLERPASSSAEGLDPYPDFREFSSFSDNKLAIVRIRSLDGVFSSAASDFAGAVEISEMCLVSADSELEHDRVGYWIPGLNWASLQEVRLTWAAGGVDAVLVPAALP